MKQYGTFEEIDRDIKYLRLKSQINLEEVKLGLHNSKKVLSDTFSPINIITSTIGSILKNAFVFKMVDKLVGIKPVKKKEYED